MAEKAEDIKKGRYRHQEIEAKWQRFWAEQGTFKSANPGDESFEAGKPKYYILDMFPYPSGAGLHVGHPVGYCATDILARYKRMRGFNVLHPMGFDAFGLPAEQYAIETNVHPAETTRKNIEMYRKQLRMFGFSYDWDREIITCEPTYYKFTQWMFTRMYESWYDDQHVWTDPDGAEVVGKAKPIDQLVSELASGRFGVNGLLDIVRTKDGGARREWSDLSEAERRRTVDRQRLAFLDEIPVNWCPALGTVLANEEVDADGLSDRGGHPVYRRPLKQWMLRITKYADRLLADLDGLDWPEPIKIKQRHWVGRSTGAEVIFPLAAHWTLERGRWKHVTAGGSQPTGTDVAPHVDHPVDCIKVYTTRPDTLFGATYMVLAPEHPLVDRITSEGRREQVRDYVRVARNRSDLDRTADTKEKTGVFTGAYAINPVGGEPIPIWTADYVLMGYGTGAIMAVPGGDTRDYEFAKAFELPIKCVVRPTEEWIQDRIEHLSAQAQASAADGLQGIAADFPEHAEAIAAKARDSKDLGSRMGGILRDRVGWAHLIEHAVAHPECWGAAFVGDGQAVNSPRSAGAPAGTPPATSAGACELNGLPTQEAKAKMIAWLESAGLGRAAVNYKLRDWLFSRQRYWGEPFPVLHGDDGSTITVADDALPVELPPMNDFKPTAAADDADTLPQPPLARASDWVHVAVDGKPYVRDLNTMPQWAGSCWYYLRFIDPQNTDRFCDPQTERYWMPIDLYVGGAEHAVLHLLYARFWHKVLFDLGYVSTREPFDRLFNQGMIQGFAFQDRRGIMVGPDKVEQVGPDEYVLIETREPVTRRIAKMSKSLKNVVNPDEIIQEHGADTFRLYEMYMGPLEAGKPWNTRDVPGLAKLCHRIWRLVVDEQTDELSPALTDAPADQAALRILHKTIQRVTEDIEQIKLNTAIAAIFEFVNTLTPMRERPRAVIEPFVLLLAPFAPHLAEELWQRLGHEPSLAFEPWPAYDPALACDDEVEVAVQVCGKIKGRIQVAADADEEVIKSTAMEHGPVAKAIAGKTIRKVIVVKGRLVNIVAT
ncbi:MAG: leucine--tRNA ligase [Phycisphaerae bacterium]